MDIEASVEVKADGFEQGGGFELLTFCDDFFQRHAGFNRKAVLRDDWSFIEVHGDEVSGNADNFDALLVGLSIGLRTGKTWQQGRMNVDDFVFVAPNEIRREDFHESGKDDKIDFITVQNFQSFLLGLESFFP